MHISIPLFKNLGIVIGLILAYYLLLRFWGWSARRTQRRHRRKEYDRLFIDIVTAANNSDLCCAILGVRDFVDKFYDEDPKEVSRYADLLRKFISKKLASFEQEERINGFIG